MNGRERQRIASGGLVAVTDLISPSLPRVYPQLVPVVLF